MGIRLVRMDQPGAVDTEVIWEYLQSCRARTEDEAAGLGPLEDCHSLDEVRRFGLPELAQTPAADHHHAPDEPPPAD